jgi:hypothetical protein
MKLRKNFYAALLAGLLALGAVACGGGGGEAATETEAASETEAGSEAASETES